MTLANVPDVGSVGIVNDAEPHELQPGAWTNGSNVRFRDSYAERVLGHSSIYAAPAVTPYWIAPYQTSSKKYMIHAGTAAVYADDGTSRTNITGTAPTGAASNRWSGGTLNGVFVCNNGVDVPMYWGGVGTLASLTGWNAAWRAASIRPFKEYLIALDITKTATRYPHMVKWSSAADPGSIPASWNEADPTVDAGEVDLAETPDLLVDGLELGDTFIIYKQRSMYAMTFQGQPFIWRFQRIPGDYGALARGCVANTPKGHIVLTAGDVIVHQGQGAQSILTGRMRHWLFTQLDSTNSAMSFVTTNPWRNEAWVCFPTAGDTSCTKALVWNWNDNTFGIRDLPHATYGAAGQVSYAGMSTWSDTDTWESDVSGWGYNEFNDAEARLVISSTQPAIYAMDVGSTFNGTHISAMLERTGIHLDAPDRVKTVKALYPKFAAQDGTKVTVEIGSSMVPVGSVTWGAPSTFTIGTDQKVDTFASGRYLAVRFSSTSAQDWRIKSYDFDIALTGKY